jgi:acyl dehydratase
MSQLSNYTYDEITVGQTASHSTTVTDKDVRIFAAVSGDVNPVHLDDDYAATTQFKQRIAHGMLTGAVISGAIAMTLPGPGTIYLGQSLRFRAPVMIGDEITVQLEVTGKRDDRKFVTIECTVVNQDGTTVATGTADLMAPTEKIVIDRPPLPEVSVA